MLTALTYSLLFAQASYPTVPVEETRLEACLDHARGDPAAGISEANTWLSETGGPVQSYPQQCLGYAYSLLLRWDAAERAFLAARDLEPEVSHFRRAQLAAMAANAALAEQRADAALASLAIAATDAAAADDAGLRALVETDRARALVLQGNEGAAEAVLAASRTLDPQAPLTWLLSATLARRLGKLDEAQGFIEIAAALAPDYAETALEAGVIAMLQGREEAAKTSWESAVDLDDGGLTADVARGYLAQLAEPAEEPAAQ
jgi:tetratricopeptide (TPR) repeat protein